MIDSAQAASIEGGSATPAISTPKRTPSYCLLSNVTKPQSRSSSPRASTRSVIHSSWATKNSRMPTGTVPSQAISHSGFLPVSRIFSAVRNPSRSPAANARSFSP